MDLLSKAQATNRRKDWSLDTVLWQKQWGKRGFQTEKRLCGQETGEAETDGGTARRLPCSWEAAELRRDVDPGSIRDILATGRLARRFCLAHAPFEKKDDGLRPLRGNRAHLFCYRGGM